MHVPDKLGPTFQRALNTIGAEARRIVQEQAVVTIVKPPNQLEPIVQKTALTPDYFTSRDPDLEPDEAVCISREQHESVLLAATSSMHQLLGQAATHGLAPVGQRISHAEAQPDHLRHSLIYQLAITGVGTQVHQAHAERFTWSGTASETVVYAPSDTGSEGLQIVKVKSQYVHVEYVNSTPQPQLVTDMVEYFGPFTAKKLHGFLSGYFEDTSELDAELVRVQQQALLSDKSSPTAFLLDEIREKALAAKRSVDMQRDFGLNIPTTEKLGEVIDHLRML